MKKFMPDETPQDRLRLLRENCDGHEETTYYKELTPVEVAEKNALMIDNLIQLRKLEEEMSLIKKTHKLKADPLKEENNIYLTEVHTGKQTVKGTLYHMADLENGMMETYDGEGELLKSRRLRPEEKQGKLFSAPGVTRMRIAGEGDE